MIVVVADPTLRWPAGGAPALAAGAGASIAHACARAGAVVQLAGKVGDDPAGDEVLLALTRDGIGHAAVLRDAGLVTPVAGPGSTPGASAADDAVPDDGWTIGPDDAGEGDGDGDGSPDATTGSPRDRGPASNLAPEDLDLALRYLTSFAVLVVAQPLGPAALAVAVESAAYAGAHLILIDATEAETGAAASVPVDDITMLESPVADPDGDFAALVGRYAAALDGGTPAAAAFRAALGGAGWEAATPAASEVL